MQVGVDILTNQLIEGLENPNDPYKQYAPVVKTANGYTIHITDDIVEPSEYARIVDTLDAATEDQTVTVYVTSNGGYADTADLLRSSLSRCKAKVIGRAAGTVASAGTLIFLACHEYEITPTAMFLFHEGMVGGGVAKASDASAYQEFYKKHLSRIFQAAYVSVLTVKEHREILKGLELWLSGEEVANRLKVLGKVVNN
jgi:ATP-dependent protease ClpP protease subunit